MQTITNKILLFSVLLLVLLPSCSETEEVYVPRPRGYHRIELPTRRYILFDSAGFPYKMQRPAFCQIVRDSSYGAKPWFIHLSYPGYMAVLHISHQNPRSNRDTLAKFFNTSLRLTGKHEYFATAITEYTYKTPKGFTAVISEIEGDVPSQFQYFVTDSTQNFFRVALYFPENRKNDSLSPIISYVKQDMLEILNTVEWK